MLVPQRATVLRLRLDTGESVSIHFSVPIAKVRIECHKRTFLMSSNKKPGEALSPLEGHFGTVTALTYNSGRLQLFRWDI